MTVLFGRYRLEEPLGAGGSAQVWRATDTRTGDAVAVKRLHPLVFADQAGRERLLREFRALRDLDERHIVRVRDLELTDDDGALILDYIAGPSLAARLAAGARLSTAEAMSIALDVAAALGAAHARAIVHRDVTPGNILLDPDDGARLTDFGIALAGTSTNGEPALTATGELVGTLRYLAPEQLRGAPATPASDVHALAAVLYEMLAGRPAYPAASPVALAEAQARGVDPIRSVPPALDAAVRRGLAPDPADRPADAMVFGHEVEDALAADRTEPIAAVFADDMTASKSVPIALPPPPRSSDGPLWTPIEAEPGSDAPTPRRTGVRVPAATAALSLLLLVGGIVFAAALDPSSTPTADPTARPSAGVAAPSTPAATPAPTPEPKADEPEDDHGNGKGKGNGNGKGGD
jgi:serine/threonine-protein kinase